MRRRLPVGRLALMVWLVALWQLLWRDVSVTNLTTGVIVATLVTRLPLGGPRLAAGHTVRPLRLLAFLGYFAWLLMVSNLVVAREVVTRRDHIRSGIVAVPLGDSSALVTTVLADAISLTPGTLSLEVRGVPPALYVHVLHMRDVEGVRRDILRLQRLVLRAIGPATSEQSERHMPQIHATRSEGGPS